MIVVCDPLGDNSMDSRRVFRNKVWGPQIRGTHGTPGGGGRAKKLVYKSGCAFWYIWCICFGILTCPTTAASTYAHLCNVEFLCEVYGRCNGWTNSGCIDHQMNPEREMTRPTYLSKWCSLLPTIKAPSTICGMKPTQFSSLSPFLPILPASHYSQTALFTHPGGAADYQNSRNNWFF